MNGIRDLFDMNGDGELDGIEMAMAYMVLFGSEELQETEPNSFDSMYDEYDEEE
jgi:hypothetical protein